MGAADRVGPPDGETALPSWGSVRVDPSGFTVGIAPGCGDFAARCGRKRSISGRGVTARHGSPWLWLRWRAGSLGIDALWQFGCGWRWLREPPWGSAGRALPVPLGVGAAAFGSWGVDLSTPRGPGLRPPPLPSVCAWYQPAIELRARCRAVSLNCCRREGCKGVTRAALLCPVAGRGSCQGRRGGSPRRRCFAPSPVVDPARAGEGVHGRRGSCQGFTTRPCERCLNEAAASFITDFNKAT